MAEVALDGIHKRYAESVGPTAAALAGVSLEVERGEFVVIVGPSGCGKSTTLRLIAGLDAPDAGTIHVSGRDLKNIAPQDRDVAMVFQGYALYPQMTVRENLAFPLRMRNVPKSEQASRVREAAELLRIEALLDRLPTELSGGECQRVAMGRAIVRKPKVFLFDEPLSNLDAALRADLRVEIGALVRRLSATAIYVTHDQVEAMTLADRICVMQAGKVLQFASPREVYLRPSTSFVGTFLGSPKMNVLRGELDGDAFACGPFRVPKPAGTNLREVQVGVRSEDVRIEETGHAFEVVAVEPLGAETHLLVRNGACEMRVRSPGFDPRKRGDTLGLALDPSLVHLFDPANGGARVA